MAPCLKYCTSTHQRPCKHKESSRKHTVTTHKSKQKYNQKHTKAPTHPLYLDKPACLIIRLSFGFVSDLIYWDGKAIYLRPAPCAQAQNLFCAHFPGKWAQN